MFGIEVLHYGIKLASIAIKGSRGFKACFQAKMFLLQAADGVEQTIHPGATYGGEMPAFGKSSVLHSTCRQEMKIEDNGIAAVFGLDCFAWFCAENLERMGFCGSNSILQPTNTN
ncbi:unnamed protein product [Camellia sinensis]